MAQNLPVPIPDLVDWCTTHVPLFTTNQAQIGLSPANVTTFSTLTEDLVKKYDAALAARQASKNATMQLQDAIAAIRLTGNAYVNVIKAFAETSNNPNVYALAGVSPNSPASTLPPPVAPTNFGATINTDGSITIKWRVSQPQGVTNVNYMIYRRVNGGGGASDPFVFAESVGTKSWTDTFLPVGVDRVEYIVQPKRGNVTGPQSNVFSLQFGSVPDGMGVKHLSLLNASESTPSTGAKLAA